MQLVRAKTAYNKIGIYDNRPLALEEIELRDKGFTAHFRDLTNNKRYEAYYSGRPHFNKEWDICCLKLGEDVKQYGYPQDMMD